VVYVNVGKSPFVQIAIYWSYQLAVLQSLTTIYCDVLSYKSKFFDVIQVITGITNPRVTFATLHQQYIALVYQFYNSVEWLSFHPQY